ncbi:MAG: 16S rRNA (cytidine(1402)-2'-O)-methyltransferase [Bacteroidia bacterium]|nr:16S rRNA (cytidine(1402)-2'-O)-methyltransferase [Bacteroidia bacterium]
MKPENKAEYLEGKLILVPTPVGNLDDITLRALQVLKNADVILAEDTRTTSNLLRHFSIEKKTVAHHQHNEHGTTPKIVDLLLSGQTIALVSDAGTPGISDAGFLLVRACVEKNIPVECLPGATAFVPALVISGLPCDRFCFEGFLPHKKGRATRLNELKEETRTIIFYESPHRLIKTLEQFCENFGLERKASVSRELTKVFEETVRGSLAEVLDYFKSKTLKGEFVIVMGGKD